MKSFVYICIQYVSIPTHVVCLSHIQDMYIYIYIQICFNLHRHIIYIYIYIWCLVKEHKRPCCSDPLSGHQVGTTKGGTAPTGCGDPWQCFLRKPLSPTPKSQEASMRQSSSIIRTRNTLSAGRGPKRLKFEPKLNPKSIRILCRIGNAIWLRT